MIINCVSHPYEYLHYLIWVPNFVCQNEYDIFSLATRRSPSLNTLCMFTKPLGKNNTNIKIVHKNYINAYHFTYYKERKQKSS